MRISRVIPPAVLFLLACSADRSDFQDEDRSKIAGQSGVVDIRADNNRDGVVSFDDDADDEEETVWNAQHGAVFIANIDDDQERCSVTVPNPTPGQPDVVANDVDLPKCNDAADEVVNGPDDELDLARIKTKPWPGATAGATGTITWTAASNVRLFKVKGGSFEVIQSGHELTTAELKTGVELAIEGKDIVRDPAKWDGYVDVTFQITAGAETGSDDVRLRVAPLITYSHVDDAEQTYVSAFNEAGNIAMRQDLLKATTAAGVPAPIGLPFTDRWAQDFFETGYMSIPGPGGTQHAMRVNIRSANIHNPADAANPLRFAGIAAFLLRGKDSAAIQEYDKRRLGLSDPSDTLNSFGNFETIPPYSHNGESFPLGRVIRGSVPSYHPDETFTKMIESQSVQPPVYVDTSWLVVSHIDETISFVKAPGTPRGWVLLANDARLAIKMLQDAQAAGYGNVPMFVGKKWIERVPATPTTPAHAVEVPAQVTISETLADEDIMAANAKAIVEIDEQLRIIKEATGITDDEIVPIPFLHHESRGYSVAYQPGTVNGIYISPTDFVAPDPHGPKIDGKDLYQEAMRSELAKYGVKAHFAEDWDGYHRNIGEVHCGTNTTRKIPENKWWESGR